ncbi:MAG: hypothetical protein J6J44_14565 [Lachnospiraceae bacterium]|nr:hypothetical protein [Lachnospiraceae bacterium]
MNLTNEIQQQLFADIKKSTSHELFFDGDHSLYLYINSVKQTIYFLPEKFHTYRKLYEAVLDAIATLDFYHTRFYINYWSQDENDFTQLTRYICPEDTSGPIDAEYVTTKDNLKLYLTHNYFHYSAENHYWIDIYLPLNEEIIQSFGFNATTLFIEAARWQIDNI